MDWMVKCGVDVQAGWPEAGAHVTNKGVWEYKPMLAENDSQQNGCQWQFLWVFVSKHMLCLYFLLSWMYIICGDCVD